MMVVMAGERFSKMRLIISSYRTIHDYDLYFFTSSLLQLIHMLVEYSLSSHH